MYCISPVKVLESEGWITRSLADEVRFVAIEQANQCRLPFTNDRNGVHTDTLVMVVTMNKTVFQRPPFTNRSQTRQQLNDDLHHVCTSKITSVY